MLYKIRFCTYRMRYWINPNKPANSAMRFIFLLVSAKRTPMNPNTKIKRASAESIKNKLQYFLPKGPKREFIYT